MSLDFMERLAALILVFGPAALIAVLLYALGTRVVLSGLATLAVVAGLFAVLGSLAGMPVLPLVGLIGDPVLATLAQAFLVAAIPEEAAKLILLTCLVLKHDSATSRRNVILAAAWLGLGFAVLENFYYVTTAEEWISVGLVRAATAIPFHIALGLMMGLLWTEAKASGAWPVRALLVPILFHGLYNWPLLAIKEEAGGAMLLCAAHLLYLSVLLSAWRLLRGRVAAALASPDPVLSGTLAGGGSSVLTSRSAGLVSLLLRCAGVMAIAGAVLAAIASVGGAVLVASLGLMPVAFSDLWRRSRAPAGKSCRTGRGASIRVEGGASFASLE